MYETLHMAESSPFINASWALFQQTGETMLDTIVEDMREAEYSEMNGERRKSCPVPAGLEMKLRYSDSASPDYRPDRRPSPSTSKILSKLSGEDGQSQLENSDDLYDATSIEAEMSDDCLSYPSTHPSSPATHAACLSASSTDSRSRNPAPLVVPENPAPGADCFKSSPIPPTPPPKIPLSPAALSMLFHSVPALNAPPSLDGSISSNQMSNITAPSTPDLQAPPNVDWSPKDVRLYSAPQMNDDGGSSRSVAVSADCSIDSATEHEDNWHLVSDNRPQICCAENHEATSALSLENAEFPPDSSPLDEASSLPDLIPSSGTRDDFFKATTKRSDDMWQLHIPSDYLGSKNDCTPVSGLSGCSFTNLSIPSPGKFFASLEPRSRRTWSFTDKSGSPPTAVAQKFYELPFHRGSRDFIEQVIECPEQPSADWRQTNISLSNGPPTAAGTPQEAVGTLSENAGGLGTGCEDHVQYIPGGSEWCEYDENYGRELTKRALASSERTDVWLTEQIFYFGAPSEEKLVYDEEEISTSRNSACSVSTLQNTSSPLHDIESERSIYWRGFQFSRKQSSQLDAFTYRNSRYEAVQSVRLALANRHIDSLLGTYELASPKRPPYFGPPAKEPRNFRDAEILAEKAQFSTLEKEQLVLAQIQEAGWAVDAIKYLNGGRLLTSPASSRLSEATVSPVNMQRSVGDHVRVLDLGGQEACEWAWELAHEYPNVNVYTVSVAPQAEAVNNRVEGPTNHRQISVSHLRTLPFLDNQFDVISARSLHALLKTEHPAGEEKDEYDLCLRECHRCLKPGGYLEYFLMDAAISRAGPVATAASIRFASNLNKHGYDTTPTKSFISRLRKGRFADIRRAWVYLPMGTKPANPSRLPREIPKPVINGQVHRYKAVHDSTRGTTDVANITGLLGGWVWEQWLLRLQLEMGWEREKLLEGVGAVFEEGRRNDAGWTCLAG